MSKVLTALKYRLLEQKNEIVARPAVVLLWLPRLALYSFVAFLTYRWLMSGAGTRLTAVFMALPVMSFLLSLLASYQKLFAAKGDSLLIVAPLTTRQFLIVKFTEVCASLPEVALLGVPVILAVGETRSWPTGFLVFAWLLLNMLFACLLSVPVALLTARAASALRRRPVLLALTLGALACGVLAVFLAVPGSGLPRFSLDLPAWFWRHTGVVVVCQGLVLCVIAVVSLKYAQATYVSARSHLAEANQPIRGRQPQKSLAIGMLMRLRGSSFAILAKDTLVSLRSPMQWLRGMLMLGLLSMYPLVRGWLSGSTPEWTMVLNVSFACLLGFVLVGEVVTNAFSAELSRICIMLAAPLPPWRIVVAKLGAYCVPMVILCEASVLVLGIVSGLSLLYLVCSALLTAFVAVGIAALLVGMGTLGAKPARESQGGMYDFMAEQAFFTNPGSFLVFLMGSIAVGLNLVLVFLPLLLRAHGIELGVTTLPLMLLLALEVNAAMVVISVSFGSRCLGRLTR